MSKERVFPIVLSVVLLLVLGLGLAQAQGPIPQGGGLRAPLGSAVTYQGQLQKGGVLVDDTCNLRFTLYDAATGGTQVGPLVERSGVVVTDGLFTIPDLDFGTGSFEGSARWLEIAVQCTGDTDYNTLTPRQELTAAPYALYSSSAPWSGLTGVPDLQLRVSGTCAAGNAIRVVNADGSVTCEAVDGAHDHWGQVWTGTGSGLRLISSDGMGLGASGTTGVWGETSATSGRGVHGYANTTGGSAVGVYGESDAEAGTGVYGYSSSTSGETYGVHGAVTSSIGTGVYGTSSATDGLGVWGSVNASGGTGVRGEGGNSSGGGTGVYGEAWGTTGIGVYGTAPGYGVHGASASTEGRGVYGLASAASGSTRGVYGEASSTDGRGVYGYATATSGAAYGVVGRSDSASGQGVSGWASPTSGTTYGVWGRSDSTSGHGVGGFAAATSGTTYGVYGLVNSTAGRALYGEATATGGTTYGLYATVDSNTGTGVYGEATAESGAAWGVWGQTDSSDGRAVFGDATATSGATEGVRGRTSSPSGYGVMGRSTGTTVAYAGYFYGDVHVTGDLSASGAKPFKIDHPLDPANKYLYHYSVESPEVLNQYTGNSILGPDGTAWVELPAYFDAINSDLRYQLTCVGGYAPVYIAQEVRDNRFQIAGGTPGLKVSWLINARRSDPYILQYGAPVEQDKPAGERGTYLYPELYGQPAELGRDYEPPDTGR